MIDERCDVCVGKYDKIICESFRSCGQCLVENPEKKYPCYGCDTKIKFKNSGYVSKRFGPLCKKCSKKMERMRIFLQKNEGLNRVAGSLLKMYDKILKKT